MNYKNRYKYKYKISGNPTCLKNRASYSACIHLPPRNPTISSVRQLISRSVISFRYTPQTTTFSASRHQAVTVKYKPLKLHSTVYKSLSLNSLFLSLNLSLSFHFPENKKKFTSLSLSRIHSCRYVITFSLLKVSIFIVKFLIFFKFLYS